MDSATGGLLHLCPRDPIRCGTPLDRRTRLVPAARVVYDLHNRQHHRNLNEDTHDSGQRRSGIEAEEANGGGDGKLEEIAGADERRRRRDAMGFAGRAIQQIGKAGVEVDLDQDRRPPALR